MDVADPSPIVAAKDVGILYVVNAGELAWL